MRIRTINPSTATLLDRGVDDDGAHDVADDEHLEPAEDHAAELSAESLVRARTGDRTDRREPKRPPTRLTATCIGRRRDNKLRNPA